MISTSKSSSVGSGNTDKPGAAGDPGQLLACSNSRAKDDPVPRNGDTEAGSIAQPQVLGTLSKDSALKKLLVPFLRIQVTPGH